MKKALLIIKYRQGFSLVEIILTVALFSMFAVGFSGIIIYGEEGVRISGNQDRALFLAYEGVEAVRSIRDEDFANLTNGTHGLAEISDVWNFSGSSDLSDIYTRDITISNYDTNIKEIVSRVTWQQNLQRTGETSVRTLLSFWQEIASLVGDWSVPLLNDVSDTDSNSNGIAIDSNDDHAFLGTARNGTDNFFSFDISDPVNVSQEDVISVSGQIGDVVVSGDYAYVSSTQNNAEITVVDISNPGNLSIADTFNLTGNQNMRGLYVDGDYLYATRDSSSTEFAIFDISTPTSISLEGSLNLSSSYRDVYVSGNRAYLVGDENSAELSVVDISTPTAPVEIATLDLSGNNNAFSTDGYGSTLFIGRANGEISIVDISGSPSLITSFDPGSAVRGIEAVSSIKYIFIAGDSNNNELRIYDVSTLSSPVLVGSYDNGGSDFNGVSYNIPGDFVVTAGEENASELTVLSSQ